MRRILGVSMAAKLQLVKAESASPDPAMLDEFGELKRQEAAFAKSKSRLEILRKNIAGCVPPNHPADQPVTFSGRLYDVNVSTQQNQRRVKSYPRLFKLLGWKRFSSVLAKLSGWVTALEAELGEEQAAAHFTEERTGPRTITAVAKASPAAPEAA